MPHIKKKKRLSADKVAPATPTVTASSGPLLDLPTELHVDIVKRLDNGTLLSLRRVCRQLEKNSNDIFGERFFTVRRHLVTTHSLRVLRDISATTSTARHIQRIELVAMVFCNAYGISTYLVDIAMRRSKAKAKREFVAKVDDATRWVRKEGIGQHVQQTILLRETVHNLAKLSLSPIFEIASNAAPDPTLRMDREAPRRTRRELMELILHDEGKHDWWQQKNYAYGLKTLYCRAWPERTSDDLMNGGIESIVQMLFDAASRNPSVIDKLHIDKVAEFNSLKWWGHQSRYPLEPFLAKSWEFLTNLTSLRFLAYESIEFWRVLLPIAINITSLHIELPRKSNKLEEIWSAAAHLNLQRIGITGGFFRRGRIGWLKFLDILAAHSDTLLEVSIKTLKFKGTNEEDRLEIIRWIHEKQNLECLNVCDLSANGVGGAWTLVDVDWDYELTFKATEQKEALMWI